MSNEITKETVFHLADQLHNLGELPTDLKIRELNNHSGRISVINQFLKSWETEKSVEEKIQEMRTVYEDKIETLELELSKTKKSTTTTSSTDLKKQLTQEKALVTKLRKEIKAKDDLILKLEKSTTANTSNNVSTPNRSTTKSGRPVRSRPSKAEK